MTADSSPLRDNPILAKFRAALEEMYGARLECVVLFGSQARGEARPDSDYDVAAFLNGSEKAFDRWAELNTLAALRVKFLDESGAFFDANPIRPPSTGSGRPSCMKSGAKGFICNPGSCPLFAKRREVLRTPCRVIGQSVAQRVVCAT